MKNEGLEWFKAGRDAQAAERLGNRYKIVLRASMTLTIVGIFIATLDFSRGHGLTERPIYMTVLGLLGSVFGWLQISRLNSMQRK